MIFKKDLFKNNLGIIVKEKYFLLVKYFQRIHHENI